MCLFEPAKNKELNTTVEGVAKRIRVTSLLSSGMIFPTSGIQRVKEKREEVTRICFGFVPSTIKFLFSSHSKHFSVYVLVRLFLSALQFRSQHLLLIGRGERILSTSGQSHQPTCPRDINRIQRLVSVYPLGLHVRRIRVTTYSSVLHFVRLLSSSIHARYVLISTFINYQIRATDFTRLDVLRFANSRIRFLHLICYSTRLRTVHWKPVRLSLSDSRFFSLVSVNIFLQLLLAYLQIQSLIQIIQSTDFLQFVSSLSFKPMTNEVL